jgi:HK97 family phage portal protein
MSARTNAARRVAGARVRSSSQGLRSRRDLGWLVVDPTETTQPPPATEAQAMGLPPFGRGVELLCSAVAGTPWRAMRWDPELGIFQRVADQPRVLVEPYPATTPWHYKWAALEDLILYGNHVALYPDPRTPLAVDDRTGRPSYVVPIPADEVWLFVDNETGSFQWTIAGELFGPDELLHVSSGNRSGEPLGRGVLRQYGDGLGGTVAAEEHSGSYYAGGALPPAVLTSPQVVTQPQALDLKSKWREMTSTREPVVLPQGYTLTPLVSSAETAQLVESRRWNAEQVAMMLGIPSWKLGLPGPSMTYQNVDQADIVWVQDSVDRWAQPLSASFTQWLMPNGTDVRWDYGSRMRADAQATATVLTTLLGSEVITIDEARAVLGRPPMEQHAIEGTTPQGVPELTPTEVA